MGELLERWSKLEPDRCKRQPTRYEVLLNGQLFSTFFTMNTAAVMPDRDAIIQAATQEAIEAHDWNWEMSKKGREPNGKWQRFASVWPAYGNGKDSFAMSLESNAHALLTAYLQALEARP